MIQSVLMVSVTVVLSSLVQSHPLNQSGPDKNRNEYCTRSNNTETKNEQISQGMFRNETFKHGLSQAQFNNTTVTVEPLENDYDVVQLSKDLDWERDKDTVKALMRKFRSKYDNVSDEDFNLEEKVKPYFRGKRNVHNQFENISKENPEFKIFDPFQGLEIPTNFPSTLNHPEEIKRWMQEILPRDSKEKIPVNDTACHQRALETLNADLKRNISKPYAHYYKEARQEEVIQFAANKFYERQSKRTTQVINYTTKSMKQMRDEIKENMGTMLDDTSLSGPSESMPSYLVREFREKYPHHCNDDAESVDASNFLFGNAKEERKRRDVDDVLKEKLEKNNSRFKSRLKEILSRSENKTKRTEARKTNETDELNMDAAREKLAQNSLHKQFQAFTINYDETPNESWETDNTKLFSFGNSLEEFINSKEMGDFKHLVGLKSSKVKEYLNSLNSSNSTNDTENGNKPKYDTNFFISKGNQPLGEKLKSNKEIFQNTTENPRAEEQTKAKKPNIHRGHQSGFRWTRPTFRKILRTQVFKADEVSPLDASKNINDVAFSSPEDIPNDNNNTRSHYKEKENANSEENVIYDLKTHLESSLEFKDGLFGLKNCNPNAFVRETVPKTIIRTTDIIIKKFAKINSTWPSPLRTQVFRNSEMEGYALDSSASRSRRDSKHVKTKRRKRSISDGKQLKHKFFGKMENGLAPENMSSSELYEKFEDKTQFKKPDFVKTWDVLDRQRYNKPNFKVIEDDGTGDMPRLIREQCKELSEENDVIEGNKSLLKKFKEIEDYGAKSMPSQLKPDGGKSDENITNFNNYIDNSQKELLSSKDITLDSNTYDYTNWDENDPQKRYKIRLERLEKLMGKKFSTAGPEYFTMPTVEQETLPTRSIISMESEVMLKSGIYRPTKLEPNTRTKSEEQLLSFTSSPHKNIASKNVDNQTKPTWITVDSEDIIDGEEGDKEQLELFLNCEHDVDNNEPWTQFDHEGMEKFLGKTLPGNRSAVYKLYRP
ncbi:hypothetical protein WDU94_007791 [Cyamophila willieti]